MKFVISRMNVWEKLCLIMEKELDSPQHSNYGQQVLFINAEADSYSAWTTSMKYVEEYLPTIWLFLTPSKTNCCQQRTPISWNRSVELSPEEMWTWMESGLSGITELIIITMNKELIKRQINKIVRQGRVCVIYITAKKSSSLNVWRKSTRWQACM